MKNIKLSLSAKLMLSFFALLIIPLISGCFTYSSIRLDEEFSLQMSEQMEMELRVDRVTGDFLQIRDIFDPANRPMTQLGDKERKEYETTRAKLQKDLVEASKVLPKEDDELLAKVRSNISQIDALANQLFSAGGSISAEQADLIVGKIGSLARGSELLLSQVREKIDERLETMFAKSRAEHVKLVRRLIISFAFLLLGPLIFWVAGRSIARPIYNLVDEAERLIAGDWDTKITTQPGMETGALSGTLEKMREHLVNYRSEVTDYRHTLEEEVRILQAAILPHEIPQTKGMQAATFYRSATGGLSIGGDFYDFIPLSNNRWGLVIGDVSGRGIEAATRTALTRFSLRSFAIEDPNPSRVLERLNKTLIPQTPLGQFITIWYGVWNPATKTIAFGNGGHPYPLLARAGGEIESLLGSDIAVGVSELAKYERKEIKLAAGDTLILYTDGLTESRSKSGEFLYESRLKDKVKELIGNDAETIAQSIGSFCIDWASGNLNDDVAIAVLRVK